ncbi:MAG: type II toxin-antitoxin system death-on-curing family toxin [Candidatus Chisholmbacteria bacterium]|nr:type II toxin-antitoxin system death-on-curing family toxin [Candidatus Chisholmbacteria bacterium]
MNWRFVEIDEAYLIHQRIIKRAGTRAAVRDFSLLHSAIERPKATYAGKYLYPSLFDKAAALLQSLCQNHPFTDGNKRTAWAVTDRFLWYNGYHLKMKTKEIVNLMLKVDNEKLELPPISFWLRKHSRKI